MGETLTVERRRLAEAVAGRWNEAGGDYAVVNGVEPGVEALGRDLDVCVSRAARATLRRLALEVFRAAGYRIRAHVTAWGHDYLFAARDERVVLEIDLFPDLRWGPARLVSGPRPASSVGVFRIDPWASYVKRVLVQVLAGNRDKLRARPEGIRPREHEREAAVAGLRRWLGDTLAMRLLAAADAADVDRVVALREPCRRAVVKTAWRQPPRVLAGAALAWLRSEVAHAFPGRCAPIVACSGADAERVSATAAVLGDRLTEQLALPGVRLRRLRPGWIGGPAVFGGGLPGWNALRYVVDFAVGGRLRDRRDSATLKLVVYDRCALDLRAEPRRFGLRPGVGSTLPWRVAERPDVVVLLGAVVPRSVVGRSLLVELPGDVSPETAAARALPAIVERFLEPGGSAAC